MKRIKNCAIIGIVERLDESFVVAEEVLRPHFSDIDLSYRIQNVSTERVGTLEEKIEQGRSDIGDKLMDELIEQNKLDLLLHKFTNEELDIRIKVVKNFGNKIIDFQKRCRKLSKIK